MKNKVGVLRFLGTNCDRDVWQAVEDLGLTPEWLWYEDQFRTDDYVGFVVPGGFSYGDYLRCGALASKAPAMKSLTEAAKKGFPILGICNGFQILCESKLLPGVLVQNESRKFVDKWVQVQEVSSSRWTTPEMKSMTLRLPIAHGEGRFYVEKEVLRQLEDNGQVWLRYVENPNGSIGDVAGVANEAGNVCGLMPHPERAMTDWMGGTNGRMIMKALVS